MLGGNPDRILGPGFPFVEFLELLAIVLPPNIAGFGVEFLPYIALEGRAVPQPHSSVYLNS